jgi:hypothetical protein
VVTIESTFKLAKASEKKTVKLSSSTADNFMFYRKNSKLLKFKLFEALKKVST